MDRRRPWSRLQLSADSIDLPALLGSLRGRRVWYCANPGNAGDALIASATRRVLRSHGLDVTEVREAEEVPDGQVILYGGGGNLVPAFTEAAGFIARHHERARHLIVLPHTIRGHEDLLAALGPNVTLVCRDIPSLGWVRERAPRARAGLAPDMALSLVPWRLWASACLGLPRSIATRSEARRLLAGSRLGPSWRGGPLQVFRADVEAVEPFRDRGLDLALRLETDVHDPRMCDLAAALYLWRIWRAREIVTDRLHVAIAGAILGRPVALSDNSYGKNRSVWEGSLAAEFPCVSFRDRA